MQGLGRCNHVYRLILCVFMVTSCSSEDDDGVNNDTTSNDLSESGTGEEAESGFYDFKVDGIYYNIISDNEVEVTYETDSDIVNRGSVAEGMYQMGTTESIYSYGCYEGAVVIPSTVTWKGNTYKVTSISRESFAYCTELESVTIPSSIETIEDYAFEYCESLTDIIMEEGVKTISDGAFLNCIALTCVTIPSSVTNIGINVFSPGITDLYVLSETPPTCDNNAFSYYFRMKCTLHVPAGTLEIYEYAPGWDGFYIVEIED